MPFLRLTRDRRGFENTYLMHADRPGDRPRLLYWYRTAPGILLGRAPLDEDAIRTIEEQHPDIDFDWPAILALSEVMTPEEEAPAPRRERKIKPQRERDRRPDPSAAADNADRNSAADLSSDSSSEAQSAEEEAQSAEEDDADHTDLNADADDEDYAGDTGQIVTAVSAEVVEPDEPDEPVRHVFPDTAQPDAEEVVAPRPHTYGLLEELVGREIATRLRVRYSEIGARVHEQYAEVAVRDAWMKRAEPLNPDLWLTPEAVLEGVRRADGLFDRLRTELLAHSSRE